MADLADRDPGGLWCAGWWTWRTPCTPGPAAPSSQPQPPVQSRPAQPSALGPRPSAPGPRPPAPGPRPSALNPQTQPSALASASALTLSQQGPRAEAEPRLGLRAEPEAEG
eukprot:gene13562-biopygen4850